MYGDENWYPVRAGCTPVDGYCISGVMYAAETSLTGLYVDGGRLVKTSLTGLYVDGGRLVETSLTGLYVDGGRLVPYL
jgi:hypothetical protein